jgi:hypothetical protein
VSPKREQLGKTASLAPPPPPQPAHHHYPPPHRFSHQSATACCPACRAVDEGTNPDTFTVQLFRDSMAQNQSRWGLSSIRDLEQWDADGLLAYRLCLNRSHWQARELG